MQRLLVVTLLGLALVVPAVLLAQPGQSRPGTVNGRPIAGQIPARGGPRPTEAPRGTAVLRGFVVAAETGSPIRRAQVRASGQGVPSRLATTDEQGRFEMRDLAAGRYTLSATKGGLVGLQYGQRRPGESGTPIEVGDGQLVEKIVIGLPRGSVISGRITDEFGEPVANAVVTAMRYGYVSGVQQLLPAGGQNARDTTDDLGQFRLFGLSPGEYVVSAAYRTGGEVTDPAGEPSGYAPTYYPGTANINEAQRVSVDIAQEQTSVIFSLIATRLVRVSGAVVSSQGTPVTGGMVTLQSTSARLGGGRMMQTFGGRLDGSGHFRIANVPPGRYIAQLRGGPGGAGSQREFGRQELMVGGDDVEGVVIVTGPGARVTGIITTDAGLPPSISPRQVRVAAQSADPEPATPGMSGTARVADDWTFELGGLFDPRLLRVNTPAGWTLKAVLLNGQDITDRPLDFAPGQTVGGVQIVLTERATQVSGRVTDSRGAPITDVTVVVFPAESEHWTYRSRFVRAARPDLEGHYEISGLPAHERYLIVAVQGLQDGQAGDPEFLSTVQRSAAAFSLNDGESRALDLRFGSR